MRSAFIPFSRWRDQLPQENQIVFLKDNVTDESYSARELPHLHIIPITRIIYIALFVL